MSATKMQDAVYEFDKKPLRRKYMILMAAERFEEDAKLNAEIIGDTKGKSACVEVVFDDIAIVSYNDWADPKTTVYSPYLKHEGRWVSTNTAYGSLEMAILGAIGCKHGDNNFGYYAAKLLA